MMRHIRRNSVLFVLGLATLDAACIAVAYSGAVAYTRQPGLPFWEEWFEHAAYLAVFILVWWGAAMDDRLWGSHRSEDLRSYLSAVTKAVGDALVFSVFVKVMITSAPLDRNFLVAFCLGTLVCLVGFRAVVRFALWRLRERGFNLNRVIIVGANPRSARLVEALLANRQYGYHIVGFIDDDPERSEILEKYDITYLGPCRKLPNLLGPQVIDDVFVCLPMRSSYETLQEIAGHCDEHGVSVRMIADLFPVRIATSRLIHVDDIPLLSLSTIPEAPLKLFLKRAVDFAVSTILLILLSPLFFLMALIIKLDSPGPVFFLQERVGQNQRRFFMIKFRSMVANAEQLREKLEAQNEADGPVFKIREDPRITRVGRFIRKYSIDEFPQLINVWLGEMSLVGPRPPLAKEVSEYSWDQRRRLSVKPGMTGLWQVSGRSDTSFHEWVEMDLEYIDRWSIWLDFQILLKTFRAVVSGRGAA